MAVGDEWRVSVLTNDNASTGLSSGMMCSFTIADYWDYGCFEPQRLCELPGKLFRARASGAEGAKHVYYTARGLSSDEPAIYTMGGAPLYAAFRAQVPRAFVEGGQFCLLAPKPGPWLAWIAREEDGSLAWRVRVLRNGKVYEETMSVREPADGWLNAQITMLGTAISLQLDAALLARYEHDGYSAPFAMTFGSGQTRNGGGEVVSEFREVFLNPFLYPFSNDVMPDGPEDIRPEDEGIRFVVNEATPDSPRHSEGDMIELADGRLYLIWSDYYSGESWDGSPARLSARTSCDGGRTWSDPYVVVRSDHGTNVMSASLLRAGNGDILLAYFDRLPDMKAKGMVLRRSADECRTWSDPICISPDNANVHAANNHCLRMLDDGRIILSTREYVGGIRWPYILFSDDDGATWRAGHHVPDGALTPAQKSGQNLNEPSVVQLADGRLLMTMRTIAGGQYFAYSLDRGKTWSKPFLSPLRGVCSPAVLERIPGTDRILAIWTYGLVGRTPLVSAASSDGGRSWRHLKLLEQSPYHGYGYTSVTFVRNRVLLTYIHYPSFTAMKRFESDPGYIDQMLTILPIQWFLRDGDL